ncbi:hypothetical protein PV328_003990 [Microctonus aethiopoides]|uniref:Uncharacterized protein n=1 Tax=Microctonus aethiopoides TaxID=144406 RepID=A0AA39F9K6_9HYME|nr:hypothetical protein PV328_003990 [Microctonus aethiopoides]
MSDSDNDNPTEIYEAGNAATSNLPPEKSREIYTKQCAEMCNARDGPSINSHSEYGNSSSKIENARNLRKYVSEFCFGTTCCQKRFYIQVSKDFNVDDLPVPLTSEEVILLQTFPPHKLRWSDIIYKHFGDQAPTNIFNILNDTMNYQNNVLRILHLREREIIGNLREKKMESLPYLSFTLYIPMEWMMTDTSYNDTIIYLMNIAEEYFNIHGCYEGLVIDIVGVQAILIVNIIERIIWFKRIRIEDDRRLPTVNYFPRIAFLHLEELWEFLPLSNLNNDNSNYNDNSDNNSDNNIVRTMMMMMLR